MSTRPVKLPAIPDPDTTSLQDVLRAVKEWIEVQSGSRGDGLDRALTPRDLIAAGLMPPDALGEIGLDAALQAPPGSVVDSAVPPTPTNLLASGAITTNILTWQFAAGYSRLAYFEIWRSLTDVLGDAAKVGQTVSPIFADDVGEAAKFYYWVRAVSDAGQSAFNAVAGTLGETTPSLQKVQDAIDAQTGPLSDGVAALGQSVDQIFTNIHQLQGADVAQQNSLAATQAALGVVTGRVDEAEVDASGLHTQVNSVSGTLSTTVARVDGLNTSTQALNASVITLQTQAADLQSSATALAGDIQSTSTRVDGLASSLTTTTGNLTQVAADLNGVTGRVDQLDGTVTTVRTDLGALSSTVNVISGNLTQVTGDVSGLLQNSVLVVDAAGSVSGFSLASDLAHGVVTSTSFTVAVDKFVLVPPSGPGAPPAESPFYVQMSPTTVNGVAVPAGVYLQNALIANGTITNAKIGNLAVDDAKISSVSVNKITAGQLQVGEYVQSANFAAGLAGFNINGAGDAEFNNAVVRGTVFANAGKIGGNIIDSTGLQSAGYNVTTAGWRIDADGTVHFNEGTFRGAVYASSGTFAGELQAATGTFAGELTAATGTFSGKITASEFLTGDFEDSNWPTGLGGSYLGSIGLRLGNRSLGQYFEVLADGSISAPGFSVANGRLTVTEASVIDTLQIAGQAVTTGVYAQTAYNGSTFYVNVNVPAQVLVLATVPNNFGAYPQYSSVRVNNTVVASPLVYQYVSGETNTGNPIYSFIIVPAFGYTSVGAGSFSVTASNCQVAVLVLRR